MSVLVNTQNERDEKVLLAFLDSLRYKYRSDVEDNADQINQAFLDHYNKEIDQADAEIEAGNYVSHQDVEKLFQKRRKAI
jgi:isopentenyldiphosphate isomerase